MLSRLKALRKLPLRLVLILLYILLFRWLRDIADIVRRLIEKRRRNKGLRDDRRGRPLHCRPRCAVVPPVVYRRADPLIYSQQYLMEQGLAVTWDNPDIQLYENGVPVSSGALKPGTTYDIGVTIWNNSLDAPAVGMPVQFGFQSFGVGAALTPIGTQIVDLPVKGAPGHPAHAKQTWTTPSTPGHYCIKVGLIWADDANPKNNIGQENTNVVAATSPAVFTFPVRNDDTIRKAIRMTADAYQIPARMPCHEKPGKGDSDRRHPTHRQRGTFVPPSEREADWTLARVRHDPATFPVPPDWSVQIEPKEFTLDAGAAQDVTVTITPPDPFRGTKAFNVSALYRDDLLGGVTLIVTQGV
jgi:hypothetical protein